MCPFRCGVHVRVCALWWVLCATAVCVTAVTTGNSALRIRHEVGFFSLCLVSSPLLSSPLLSSPRLFSSRLLSSPLDATHTYFTFSNDSLFLSYLSSFLSLVTMFVSSVISLYLSPLTSLSLSLSHLRRYCCNCNALTHTTHNTTQHATHTTNTHTTQHTHNT